MLQEFHLQHFFFSLLHLFYLFNNRLDNFAVSNTEKLGIKTIQTKKF